MIFRFIRTTLLRAPLLAFVALVLVYLATPQISCLSPSGEVRDTVGCSPFEAHTLCFSHLPEASDKRAVKDAGPRVASAKLKLLPDFAQPKLASSLLSPAAGLRARARLDSSGTAPAAQTSLALAAVVLLI